MPAPSRKTSKRITRMLTLHRKGASSREIAEELDVAHLTVRRWLADMGLEPNGGHGPRERRRRTPEKKSASEAAGEAKLSPLAPVADGAPPQDRAAAFEFKRARVAQISLLTDSVARDVAMGRATPATLASLMKLEQVSLRDLAELAPAPVVDPENDPSTAAAAEAVVARLMATATAARARARCVHCGRNPHG